MKIYFRELKNDDIPAIREICKDMWEGHDYVPHVIEEWLGDKDSLNYGAFIDEFKKDLVAFNRVRVNPLLINSATYFVLPEEEKYIIGTFKFLFPI